MARPLHRGSVWLLRKVAVSACIVLGGIAAYGAWLFAHSEGDDASAVRAAEVARFTVERTALMRGLDATRAKRDSLQVDIDDARARIDRADRVLANLSALESTWARWRGDAQQAANDEQRRRTLHLREASQSRLQEARAQQVASEQEAAASTERLAWVNSRLSWLADAPGLVMLYLERSWDEAWWVFVLALCVYLWAPLVTQIAIFHGAAPWIARGRSLHLLSRASGARGRLLPEITDRGATLDVGIWPGERLLTRRDCLGLVPEGVLCRPRWMLDGRFPFSCLFAGLTGMRSLLHGHVGGEETIQLTPPHARGESLVLVQVPEGASLVVRPSRVAAVIARADRPTRYLKRHWQLASRQSWAAGQCRHFEFTGPCRLVLVAEKAVRGESLHEQEGTPRPVRRLGEGAVFAFSPELEYAPVRTESFWAYVRGRSPIFDDLFTGTGLLVWEGTGRARRPARGWRARGRYLRSSLLRFLGL